MEQEWRETNRMEPEHLPLSWWLVRLPLLAVIGVVALPLAVVARGVRCVTRRG